MFEGWLGARRSLLYDVDMRLHGAMLFVKDLGRMMTFYSDVLGLQPNEETRLDDWVEFRDAAFALHAIPAPIAAGIQIDSPPRAREQSAAKLTFQVQDVDATLTRIEAMGLPLLRRPWGSTEAVDPEGNVIALCEAT
jgi:predicted enzyme related to lactoylglutathione lyase